MIFTVQLSQPLSCIRNTESGTVTTHWPIGETWAVVRNPQ